jgi:hypothetical protein
MQMRTRYVRLYTEEDGLAVFEDKEIEFEPGYAVPPAEPLNVAQFFGVEKSFWIGAPTSWKGEEPHPAPGRQIFVTVQGEYEVTAGDGAVRKFPAGRVLLLEDTTGTGHSTRITSADDCVIFAVSLA